MRGRVFLYVKQQLECMELFYAMDNMLVESLWISEGIKCGIVLGICYRSTSSP